MSCENLAINGKTPSIRKKYTERKGPPYSAPDCQNEYKQGNDGLWYQSTKNSAGIWTWKKALDYAPHVPSPVPLTDDLYTYEMIVLPKLLNCAYSDSVYTQLTRADQVKIVDWFKTYAPYAVDTFIDLINSIEINETESHNGIRIVITGPKDKAEIMESMIPEMLRDPDDDGNYPLNFYYPGAEDEIDCLVSSDIVSAGFVKSFVEPSHEPSPEPTPEPSPQPIPRKKTVAEWRKECKEMGMVYDPELKDCRPSKRGGQQVAPPIPMPIPAGKKKTIAEMRKECKDKGMVYDPTLKDCRPSKRIGLDSEIKKLYQENMAILEKLRINIENASKSADPIGTLTEYKTLLEPMV